MSKSVAELNQIATEVAQAIGHCSQELLLEIHAKLKEATAETATPSTDA
jgi:hypothetical protein